MQLIAWLGIFFIGYTLLLWPFVPRRHHHGVHNRGPGAVGDRVGRDQTGAALRTILDIASLTGIVTITLQIAYLPTLYSAFNRRETEVAAAERAGRRPVLGS